MVWDRFWDVGVRRFKVSELCRGVGVRRFKVSERRFEVSERRLEVSEHAGEGPPGIGCGAKRCKYTFKTRFKTVLKRGRPASFSARVLEQSEVSTRSKQCAEVVDWRRFRHGVGSKVQSWVWKLMARRRFRQWV